MWGGCKLYLRALYRQPCLSTLQGLKGTFPTGQIERGTKMAGKQISVLLVDDETDIRNVMEYRLRADGFKVYMAEDGSRGLKLARRIKPSVILLDWMMPHMDGLQILAELKRRRKTKRIPVFMFTAKGIVSDMDKAFAAGADDYISKPCNMVMVGDLIRKKLQNCRENRALKRRFHAVTRVISVIKKLINKIL